MDYNGLHLLEEAAALSKQQHMPAHHPNFKQCLLLPNTAHPYDCPPTVWEVSAPSPWPKLSAHIQHFQVPLVPAHGQTANEGAGFWLPSVTHTESPSVQMDPGQSICSGIQYLSITQPPNSFCCVFLRPLKFHVVFQPHSPPPEITFKQSLPASKDSLALESLCESDPMQFLRTWKLSAAADSPGYTG